MLYVYDALYRLVQKQHPDCSTANYVYDLVGKLQQVTDPSGTYGFAYDNMGRLVGTTTRYLWVPGQTFTNTYAYDAASNRVSATVPGNTSTYQYDSLNRRTLSSSWAGAFGFSYDSLGRRTQTTRPNGVNTSYTFDSQSRLLSIMHGAIDGATYTVDNAGNRLTKQNLLNGVNDSYTYDAIYELTQVTRNIGTGESYTYDPVGNRLSSLGQSPYQYNSSNELTSLPGWAFGYDNNGNMTGKATSTAATGFYWDFDNRLTSVLLPNSGGTVTFAYDPFGRRIEKVSPSGTTGFVYDGVNVVAVVNSSGALTTAYTQGLGIDQPLAMLRSSVISYYEADGLGSITSLTNTAGALAQTYSYDTFGNALSSSGNLVNPYRFTARVLDSETGEYYYRARYYDPALGRFISEDPIKFKAGPNFYEYALNSPLNWKDPSGLDVTIYLYPGGGSQGHIGVAVNGNQSVGFYPLSDWGIFWGPGIVKPDARVPSDSITIPTTSDQDEAIQLYLDQHIGLNNGNYSVTWSNCARFVEKSLRAGSLSASDTAFPWILMEDLHKRYDPRPTVDTSIPLGDGLSYQPDIPIQMQH